MSEYLWDRSGPVDPEIAEIEQLLKPFRSERRLKPPRAPWWPAAVAAAALIAFSTWLFVPAPPRKTAWRIHGKESEAVYAGQVLQSTTAPLQLRAEDIGEVDLSPESRLRVVESRAGKQRLALDRGTLHALIWAPPAEFVVDTPSARATDLGCEYTLSMQSGGDGLIHVETGWVAFDHNGRESFIPAGAACRTSEAKGLGTPFFEDASPSLQAQLLKFDITGDSLALRGALNEARPKDALTIWHLLSRARATDRGEVFDRFSGLTRVPPEVTRAGIIAGDRKMLDLCWNSLDLENTEWWRHWKHSW